jgi:hypothetical protein
MTSADKREERKVLALERIAMALEKAMGIETPVATPEPKHDAPLPPAVSVSLPSLWMNGSGSGGY